MKLMIATMIRGRRSWRSPSTRSWNGVVNASSSAACTLIQLLRAIVANCRRPSPLIVSVSGPRSIDAQRVAATREHQRQRREQERRREERPAGRAGTGPSRRARATPR